jgi:peroxiredoxin Q/BCP
MKWTTAIIISLVLVVPAGLEAVEVGDKAPDFALPSTQGGKTGLSDFAGKKEVVLLFYPMDFTPT